VTEAEWLASGDVEAMLNFVARHSSRRKGQLFEIACCQRHEELLDDPCRETLDALERAADEPVAFDEWTALENDAGRQVDALWTRMDTPHTVARWMMASAVYDMTKSCFGSAANEVCRAVATIAIPPTGFDISRPGPRTPGDPTETAAQASLLRDIFGNPFRRPFSPAWRTDTVLSLARTMYAARDFSAMPILADALQDAGCDNDDILSHCRNTQLPHVRGCWVVDRVLEKL
jgi:hypothetical protein